MSYKTGRQPRVVLYKESIIILLGPVHHDALSKRPGTWVTEILPVIPRTHPWRDFIYCTVNRGGDYIGSGTPLLEENSAAWHGAYKKGGGHQEVSKKADPLANSALFPMFSGTPNSASLAAPQGWVLVL